VLVSLFSVIGEVVEPKSFAGLFGAAPSVALASLGLTIAISGVPQAVIESRSMMLGAVAFGIYSGVLTWLIARKHLNPEKGAIAGLAIWFASAFGLWAAVLR
jgi:hypothetical protein